MEIKSLPVIDKKNYQYEASRCLACYDPPCVEACPASVPIPRFIRALNSGNIDYAADLVRGVNPMISICGEVCPAEDYCMDACTRNALDKPVEIRRLHKFATDYGAVPNEEIPYETNLDKRVAIVGGGPAGLTCAAFLWKSGVGVTVYEIAKNLGGVPSNEIPEFRLAADKMEADVGAIRKLGIEWKLGENIEHPSALLKDYDAVFLSTGLPEGKGLNIPGEGNERVYSALEFLRKAKHSPDGIYVGDKVVVIGGGNVSLDVASTAHRLGAEEVHLVYRRGVKEIKIWESELREAMNAGVIIHYLCFPKEFIIENNELKGLRCGRNELSDELDSSNRRKPIPLDDSYDFLLPCDTAIVSIGLKSESITDRFVPENIKEYKSKEKGIFIGGDLITGEGTVVEAVRQGKEAAGVIVEYLKGGKW